MDNVLTVEPAPCRQTTWNDISFGIVRSLLREKKWFTRGYIGVREGIVTGKLLETPRRDILAVVLVVVGHSIVDIKRSLHFLRDLYFHLTLLRRSIVN